MSQNLNISSKRATMIKLSNKKRDDKVILSSIVEEPYELTRID